MQGTGRLRPVSGKRAGGLCGHVAAAGGAGLQRTTRSTRSWRRASASPLTSSLEVAGGCEHKVHGRSGVFEGAEGRIKFLDVIAGVTGDPVTGDSMPAPGPNNFPYYGRMNFDFPSSTSPGTG